MLKRLFDIAVATSGLLFGAPALALLAVAVKVDSRGPALFSQTRVGRGRRPIRIYKFRTMVANAERHGPAITSAQDPRITRVGGFLRCTKLDELPQLWSILRGDMSFVGPRPEVPRYVDQYRPEWAGLLDVRPGLTDLASLTFRHEERLLALARDRERAYSEVVMPMKVALALEGVRRASFLYDLSILARTALAVIRPQKDDPVIREAARRIELLNREKEAD